MSKSDQEFYERRLSMMSDPAWKELIDEFYEYEKSVNRVDTIESDKELWFRQGELKMLTWFSNLRNIAESMYQQLQEEDNA